MSQHRLNPTPTTCIFCLKSYLTRQPEHFLLESLGGRRAPSKLDCPECNYELGNELDRAFSKAFDPIKNLLQIVRQSGRRLPAIRNLELGDSGRQITLSGDGRTAARNIQIKSPDYPIENGKRKIELHFDFLEDLESNFDHVCKANKLSPRQLVEALRQGKAYETSHYTDETFKCSFQVDESIGRRSATKALLLYLADREGIDLALKPEFTPARRFARYGEGVRWTITDWRPDLMKPVGSELRDGGANHWIAVYRSKTDGPVIGVLCLFGCWVAQVDLAKSSSGPPFGHLHDLDPLSGRYVDVTFNPNIPENIERLERAVQPNLQEIFITNLKSVLALAWTRARERTLQEIIDRTYKDVLGADFPEEAPIPSDKWEIISGKLALRIGHHATRISFKEERDLSGFLDKKELALRDQGLW